MLLKVKGGKEVEFQYDRANKEGCFRHMVCSGLIRQIVWIEIYQGNQRKLWVEKPRSL